VPFTELTSPNNSPVQVNVYVSCDDLMVQQPNSSNIPTDRFVVESDALRSREESVVGLPTSESADFRSGNTDVPVSCFSLVRSNVDMHGACLHHFGESVLSFRILLKRYVTDFNVTLGAQTGSQNVLVVQSNALKVGYPAYGFTSSTGSQDPTLFQYLAYAFVGMRGGMRKRFHVYCNGDDVRGQLSRVNVTITDLVSYAADGASWAVGVCTCDTLGTVSFVPHTNGGIEFEIPFYTANLFAFAFSDDLVGDGNALNDMLTAWSQRANIVAEIVTTSTANYVVIESAAGEDFTFMRFNGAPMFSTPVD